MSGIAPSAVGRPLEGPKSRGRTCHSRAASGVVRAEVHPEWELGWEEPREQAESSRVEVEGRELKGKTWI